MIILVAIIFLVIAYYWFRKTKFLLNPITVMLGIWGIILPFSIEGFYGTYVPSTRAFAIICIGLFAFFIGAYFGIKPFSFTVGTQRLSAEYNCNYKFNYTFIYILGIIALAFYIYQSITVVGLLRAGHGFDYIRQLAVSTESTVLKSSTFLNQLNAIIVVPTTYLVLAIFPIELFNKNRHKWVLIEAIVLMLFYVFTTAGRSVILWLVYYLIFILFYTRANNNWDIVRKVLIKYRFRIIFAGIALVVFLLLMTFFRKGSNVDLLRQLYIYFVCPIQNFDYHIDVVDNSGIYGFGLSSFYGLLYPFMYLLRRIGINVFTPTVLTIHDMSFQDLETGVNIGGDVNSMNAFVTSFYQPYLDGRYVGVILIMILFGFVSARFFYSAYYKRNMKSLLLYILIFQMLMGSMVRFYFTQQAHGICFILAFLVIFKCSEKQQEKAIKF